MRKPKSPPLGSTKSPTIDPDGIRDRHGFRGVPPPLTNFSLAALADDALLNETETAAVLRLSTNTLCAWRQQLDHPLKWLALPNGYVRYTVSAIRAYLAMGRKRKSKDDSPPQKPPRQPKPARRSSRRQRDPIEVATP